MSYWPAKVAFEVRFSGPWMEVAMQVAQWQKLLAEVAGLSGVRRAELLAALGATRRGGEVVAVLESTGGSARACPHCTETKVVRNGSASGLQRYKCRGCGRTFNALSTTPLARLRMKAKWLDQQGVLNKGLSVKQAAQALGVAGSTAFRWRHRFLELAQPVKAPGLAGVVEADETYFLRSSKGQKPGRKPRKRGGKATRKDRGMDLIPVLVVRDRSGATADFLLDAVSKASFTGALRGRVHDDAVLCTDGSAAMAAAAKALGVEHQAVNLSKGQRTRGPWHIQNANSYHGRLKGWMHRFKGVATSYLESYLGWFRALDRASQTKQKSAPMLALAVGSRVHH